jgi:acyl-CoA-binding protein
MILLLFPFIPLFESPQLDFLVKRYAEFKKRTFEDLDLETILLFDLPPNVTMKFWPF